MALSRPIAQPEIARFFALRNALSWTIPDNSTADRNAARRALHEPQCTTSFASVRRNNPPQRSQYFSSNPTSLLSLLLPTQFMIASRYESKNEKQKSPGAVSGPGLISFYDDLFKLFSFTSPNYCSLVFNSGSNLRKYPSSYPDLRTCPF
jgi:hypothetical protein